MVIQCKKISGMKVTNTRRDCHCRIHCNLGEDRSIRPWNERPKFPTMEGIRHGKVAAITRIHRPHGIRVCFVGKWVVEWTRRGALRASEV